MSDKDNLKNILADLKRLFKKKEILAKDFRSFLNSLQSKEVENYLTGISKGSKPEAILREVFFTINSPFAQYLFKDVFPEVTQADGFIDYLIKSNREEISLEIKPLFTGIFKNEKTGRIFSKLKKKKLNPEEHKTQILKYLKETSDYVVLTNLEEWYFFSKDFSLDLECKPFGSEELFKLLEDFTQVDDFWFYLDKKEELNIKEPLDENFFSCLKTWVSELNNVKFLVKDDKKLELIINLINKFIFVQSLDSFWVISKNYIQNEWIAIERKWAAKNTNRILKKFLEDINEYFYELYDTELFKIAEENKTVLSVLDSSSDNISLFYEKLKLILGVEYGEPSSSWVRGITQFNFRRIDEDVLGKSYETFLAEIRKEQGIYYTPKYITQFIIDNTIKKKIRLIIEPIPKLLEEKKFKEVLDLINELFEFKVLDPACGSGSFLIKALKVIWSEYNLLNSYIEKSYSKYSRFTGEIVRSKEIEKDFKQILEIKEILGFKDRRKLISKIIIRHIFGIDLDKNAIEVAKLNLWLESIKLSPQDFQFDKVPADTNHILPDLEINLCNGDSLVGLPDDFVIDQLSNSYSKELTELITLRNDYLENPANIESVKRIVEIKTFLNKELYEFYEEYLESNGINNDFLDKSVPLHWPLDFWYVYFNNDLMLKDPNMSGFTSVIGNPPYFTIRGKGTGTLTQTISYNYLKSSPVWKKYFRSQSDIYYYFIIKSISILKSKGNFGFIIESYWLENDYADKLKGDILGNVSLEFLVNFGKVKKIFEDANNDTCILIFEKDVKATSYFKYVYCNKNFSIGTPQQNNQRLVSHIVDKLNEDDYSDEYIELYLVAQNNLNLSKWILSRSDNLDLINKIELNKIPLGGESGLCEVGQGVVPGRKKEFRISADPEITNAGGYWTSIRTDEIEVVSFKSKKKYTLETELVKPLITNSGIRKYILIENQEFLLYTVPLQDGRLQLKDFTGVINYLKEYEKELKERYDYDGDKYPWYGYQRIQNIKVFENSNPKIICPYRAKENRFALDEKGYFGTTDMYGILPKANASVDILYLLGILNSKVLTFWYKVAGKSKGQILEYFANPLSRMPIYLPSIKAQAVLSNLVSEIMILKKADQKFKEIWSTTSQKFRSGIITLEKLMLKDKVKVQNGKFGEVWISDTTIFPDSQSELLIKTFKEFDMVLDGDFNLKLYGVKDKEVQLLINIQTKLKEFRDILYLEIDKLSNSSKKIYSLKDILKKAEISVIKPNIWEKSFNLIKYSNEKFNSWKLENGITFEIDAAVELESRIENLESEVEARVLKYYGLTLQETEVMFTTLMIGERIKNKVIEKFNSLH